MIENMTDEEKTVILARLMGWTARQENPPHGMTLIYNYGPAAVATNKTLYDPRNMALAWRVLNWWNAEWKKHNAAGWATDLLRDNDEHIFGSSPQEAVRRILDTVLVSAIESGMIPEETK